MAVILLGAGAGVGEMVSRYRDAPLTAIRSQPGTIYLFLNAGISLLAFVCLRVLPNPPEIGNEPTSFATYLFQSVAAGFGAMALLRTSFFNVRIGDKDVGLGPGLVLQVILDATDREVDRQRAQSRSTLVQDVMRGISFAKARIALPAYCIALMQNLSATDQQELGRMVDNLSKQSLDDETLSLLLGLSVMTFVGPNVLEGAVGALDSKIKGFPCPLIQGIAPSSTPSGSPASLRISGSGFRAGSVVWVAGASCANVVVTDTLVTCDVPPIAAVGGPVSVVIANPDGQSTVATDKFSFL